MRIFCVIEFLSYYWSTYIFALKNTKMIIYFLPYRIVIRFKTYHIMNMKHFFYLLILSLAFSANAQHRISGKIVDEADNGIPSATVQVLNTDSSFVAGSVSDGEGLFVVPEVKEGSYLLSISYIGYVRQLVRVEMPDRDYALPPVVLREDNVALGDVTVTGTSFIQKKDHLLVIPDKQSRKHAFGGYDLLYNLMIPGVTVDRNAKKVQSMAGEAKLYINGVEADMREIQNLRPKDVERVEYYVLPTNGPFSGDAAAINYVLKTYSSGGYVNLDGTQTIGYTKGDYNMAAKLSHNQTSYTLFAGSSVQRHDGLEDERNEYIAFPVDPVTRTMTHEDARYRENQQYAQFKVSHDNAKHNIYAQASYVRDDTPQNDRSESLFYPADASLSSLSQETNVDNVSDKHRIKTYLFGSYSRNHHTRGYREGDFLSHTRVSESLYSFEPYIAYTFEPDKYNSFYGRIFYTHNISSSNYTGDYDSWQHLWSGETFFWFDYTHMFGDKWTLMFGPGASFLNYKLHGEKAHRRFNFQMNTWVRYVINPRHWAGVGVMAYNSSPDIHYLNSVDQTVDAYRILRGNPDLENMSSYQWYAMYEGNIGKFNLQGKVFYTKHVHAIYTDYHIEGDKLVGTYASDGSFNQVTAEIAASYRLSDHFRTSLTIGYDDRYVPGIDRLNRHNFRVAWDANYFIKSFAINAYAKTKEKRLDETTRAFVTDPASYGFSVRYSGKNWMAEVGTENPFSKQLKYREYADYDVYRYDQVRTSRIYQQTVYVKLAYTFDFGKKTSRDSNDVDRGINSAILKVR